MRRSVSAFAAIVLVSWGCSAFASTHSDSKKTHVKTQSEQESTQVSKTDHTVPATPTTGKEGTTQVSKTDHAVPATPTGKVTTHVSKTDHTVPATPTLKDVPHVKAEDRIDPTVPANLASTAPAGGNGCPGGGSSMPFHVKRSQAARTEFMRNSGYPDGRKGYTVAYFTPLECGGSDTPDNMQWKPVDFAAAGKTASTHP
jgi:hypothetical protein